MCEFFIPTKISINSVEAGFNKLLEIKNQVILILCSENRRKQEEVNHYINMLEKDNKILLVSRKIENPTVEILFQELEKIDTQFQYVVSIGGGSTIDLAKGIIALSYLKEGKNLSLKKVEESIVSKEYCDFPSKIKHIAIPTTSGTGSEITSWATIWNPAKAQKFSIDAPWLAPYSAMIIPEFTKSLSQRSTLSTGLDALSHAAESYWSKKSTPITREFSRIGIKKIVQALPKVLKQMENLEYRTQMCEGVIYASIAFSNTRTAASHSISYPLTMRYGIEHGFAVAATLAEVMNENQREIPEYEALLQAFGKNSVQEIKDWLKELCSPIQNLDLKSLGVPMDELRQIAEQSFTAGRMDNNIVEFNVETVGKILEACYEDKR